MEPRKGRRSSWPLPFSAAMLLLSCASAVALEPTAQRGQPFVRANCAQCHSIDKISASSK